MGVKAKYRIEVSSSIEVAQRFAYLFDNKTTVPRGCYDVMVDSHQYDKERDIQEIKRLFPKSIEAKIIRRFME